MIITKHAEQRFSQRGIQTEDLEMCMAIGEFYGDEEIFISNKAADEAIRRCKNLIKRIERVRNKKFVAANGCWITAYPPGKHNMKKMLRNGRKKGLSS